MYIYTNTLAMNMHLIDKKHIKAIQLTTYYKMNTTHYVNRPLPLFSAYFLLSQFEICSYKDFVLSRKPKAYTIIYLC